MYSSWEQLASRLEKEYGIQVDWEERFFICPECGEPIYEEDWIEEELSKCPICEFEY